MTHRGITLIELLIAIAILLVIGAIVTPRMIRTLDERRFESAAEHVELQLMLARSYAQRMGEPVEVRYHPDSRRIIARRFMQTNDELDEDNSRVPAARREGARNADSIGAFDDDDDDENAITEAWAERTLPRGITLSDERPQSAISAEGRAMRSEEDGFPALDTEPIRLAVFLPDGSAMLTRTAWLTDNHDRLGRIRISAWTGDAKYERLPDLTDDFPPLDEAEVNDAMSEMFNFD